MGDIPWSEALQPGAVYQPKLDSQESIYQDVFDLLDEAIDNLRKEDLATLTPVGTQDLHLRLARCRPTGRALDQGSLWSEGPLCPPPLLPRTALRSGNRLCRQLLCLIRRTTGLPLRRQLVDQPLLCLLPEPPLLRGQREPAPEARRAERPARKPLLQSLSRYRPTGVRPQRRTRATAGLLHGISGLLSPTRPTLLLSYHELQFVKAEAQTRLGQTGDAIGSPLQRRGGRLCPGGSSDARPTTISRTSSCPASRPTPSAKSSTRSIWPATRGEVLETYHDYRRLLAMDEGDLLPLANPLPFPLRAPLRQQRRRATTMWPRPTATATTSPPNRCGGPEAADSESNKVCHCQPFSSRLRFRGNLRAEPVVYSIAVILETSRGIYRFLRMV